MDLRFSTHAEGQAVADKLNAGKRETAVSLAQKRRDWNAGDECGHYWTHWISCGFGHGHPSQGIRCFICGAARS